jgi:hypothetical protein
LFLVSEDEKTTTKDRRDCNEPSAAMIDDLTWTVSTSEGVVSQGRERIFLHTKAVVEIVVRMRARSPSTVKRRTLAKAIFERGLR